MKTRKESNRENVRKSQKHQKYQARGVGVFWSPKEEDEKKRGVKSLAYFGKHFQHIIFTLGTIVGTIWYIRSQSDGFFERQFRK